MRVLETIRDKPLRLEIGLEPSFHDGAAAFAGENAFLAVAASEQCWRKTFALLLLNATLAPSCLGP